MMDPELEAGLDTIMEDESAPQQILKSVDEEEKSWWPPCNFEQHHPKSPSSVASTTDGVIDAHIPTTLQQVVLNTSKNNKKHKSPIVAGIFQLNPKRSENLGKSPSLIAVVGSRSRRESRNCFINNNGIRNPHDGSFPSNNDENAATKEKCLFEKYSFKMWALIVFLFALVATGVGVIVWHTGGNSSVGISVGSAIDDDLTSVPSSKPLKGGMIDIGMDGDDIFPTDSPTSTTPPSSFPSQPPNSSLSWLLVRENQIRMHLTKNYDYLYGGTLLEKDEKYPFLIKGTPQYHAYQWILQQDKTLEWSPSEDEGHWETRLNQRYALALLYYSNGGDNWLQSEKFLVPDTHECSWIGIDCIRTQSYIMSIRLDEMNLTGTFPTSEFFYMLSHTLEIAAFDNNSLKGFFATIDDVNEAVCIAKKLRWLNLGNNSLIETLPKKLWSQMPNLTHFYLHQNQLVGTIPEFDVNDNATFIPIQALWLQENNLTGPLPESIETWSDLEQLRLHENQFNSSIPSGLWKLPDLMHLHLSENQFTGLIFSTNERNGEDHEDNTAAESVSASASAIMSIPEDITNDPISEDDDHIFLSMNGSKLETLWLSNNLFSGNLPPSLPPSIETVWLEHNQLTGSIPWQDLSYCVNLTSIRLHDNQISGGTLGCDTMVKNDNEIRNNETVFDLGTINLESSRTPIRMDENGMGYFTADCSSSVIVECSCCQCF